MLAITNGHPLTHSKAVVLLPESPYDDMFGAYRPTSYEGSSPGSLTQTLAVLVGSSDCVEVPVGLLLLALSVVSVLRELTLLMSEAVGPSVAVGVGDSLGDDSFSDMLPN